MSERKVGEGILIKARIIGTEDGGYLVECPSGALRMVKDVDIAPKDASKAYEDGLNDAWETARRIVCTPGNGGLNPEDYRAIFSECAQEIFTELTPQEVADRIRTYEERKNNICVGDIVKYTTPSGSVLTGAVTGQDGCTRRLLLADGRVMSTSKQNLTKTGRTVDVQNWLAQIGGAE